MSIIIHIGLHKTGTTFLQEEVFPKIKNVNYNRDVFWTKNYPNKINIISNEWISGQPYHSKAKKEDREIIAHKIHRIYPKAKIIIGIRDKQSWIKSLHVQYVRKGGTFKFNDWYSKIFNKEMLDFDGYIELLKSMFDKVYVYHFEELKKDHKKFVKNICDFIECDVPNYKNIKHNTSWNSAQLSLALALNKIYRSEMNPEGFIPWNKYFNPRSIIDLRPYTMRGGWSPFWEVLMEGNEE